MDECRRHLSKPEHGLVSAMPPPGWSSLDTAIADMSNPSEDHLMDLFTNVFITCHWYTVKVQSRSCPVDDVIHLLHSSRRLGWSSALFATREEEETYSPIHRLLFPPYLHICWHHHVLLSDLYTSYARISRTHLCCFSSLHCPRVFDTSTMRRQHLKLVSQPQVFHHCGFQNGGPAEAEQGTHSPIEH